MKKLILSAFLVFSFIVATAQNQVSSATNATAGTLTVTFSTSSTSTYAAAIYITNSSGSLVNTMLYRTSNGDGSAQDMSTYWSKIGSSWSTSSTKLLTNTDAVTGSTTTSAYTAKQIFWGKTASIAAVADGTYTVNFEMANYSPVSRRYTFGTFVKGATASTTTLPNVTGFSSITIAWVPVNTAVQNVELEKLYSVYPNPAISNIYVSGSDVKEVEICSLAGKSLIISKEQHVNVSALPKGLYLVVVRAKAGTVVKKIEKL